MSMAVMNQKQNSNTITCKYCGAGGVVKYGSYKGVQRYWCKVCQRKFKDDDTTFHMKVSPQFISWPAPQKLVQL